MDERTIPKLPTDLEALLRRQLAFVRQRVAATDVDDAAVLAYCRRANLHAYVLGIQSELAQCQWALLAVATRGTCLGDDNVRLLIRTIDADRMVAKLVENLG